MQYVKHCFQICVMQGATLGVCFMDLCQRCLLLLSNCSVRPRDHHTKGSKSERETNTIGWHLYVGSKIQHKRTYLWNRNRIRDIGNRLVVPKGRDSRRQSSYPPPTREFGISRCKLIHTERMSNKVLLHGTGSYIQYPVINHNGKEYGKIYTTESLSYSRNEHNIVNQLSVHKILKN